ncbi:hypothetical protein SAMN02746062_00679 [Alysiella filiformis DSM 16848]|uniref:Uncharacterized protein n=2 Tax=Alysiella TaxID=194195 RepID=A0A286E6Y6_9NEIS|nr:hypothetical protein SAMN02746062_00679 [Alysiella filiformis DSM 16848]
MPICLLPRFWDLFWYGYRKISFRQPENVGLKTNLQQKENIMSRKPLRNLTPKEQKIMGWTSLAVWLILTVNLWSKSYSSAFKTWVTVGNTAVFLTIAVYAFANLKLSEKQRWTCMIAMIIFALLINGMYQFLPRN